MNVKGVVASFAVSLALFIVYFLNRKSGSAVDEEVDFKMAAGREMRYSFAKSILKENQNFKFEARYDHGSLTYLQFLQKIQKDKSFRNTFFDILRDGTSFGAYFFETPKVNRANIDKKKFEFVLIKASSLQDVPADTDAFNEHFTNCKKDVVTFWNLGRDALLVAPCPYAGDADHKKFTHLAEFMRHAKNDQIHEFWMETGKQMEKLVQQRGDRYTWLSTCGTGVYWLHMRMDSVPKYYSYGPYRQ